MGSGLMTLPMDSITSQTPACGYTTFTYHVAETSTYAGQDLAQYGITVDNSVTPANLLINTALTQQYLDMEWWAIPSANGCQTPIKNTFTIQIFCPITALTLVSTFAASYTMEVSISGSIA